MQDVTYVRDAPPETMAVHPHARATTRSGPAGRPPPVVWRCLRPRQRERAAATGRACFAPSAE